MADGYSHALRYAPVKGFDLRPLTKQDFFERDPSEGLSAGILTVDRSRIDDDELEGVAPNLD